MKKFKLLTVLCITIFFSTFLYSQDFQGYIVKKIGNLVVIDIGSKQGLIKNSSYIIKKVESLKIPLLGFKIASKEFELGKFDVTQLEEDYSIGRISSRTKKEFSTSDKVSIYFYSYSDFISEKKEKIKEEKEKIPKEVPEKPKEIEKKMPWEKRNPMLLGGGYGFGMKSIPQGVMDNLKEFLLDEIYMDKPEISSSVKLSNGFGFTLGYLPFSFLSVEISYFGLNNKSSLISLSGYTEDVEISGPLPVDPIKSWDFEIKTKMSILSVSAAIGNYGKIIENYKYNRELKGLVGYFGGGINYCNLGITYDENYVIYGLNNQENLIYKSEKFSPGNYFGWFGKIGFGYMIYGGIIFTEFKFDQWENLNFDKSFYSFIGFKTYF